MYTAPPGVAGPTGLSRVAAGGLEVDGAELGYAALVSSGRGAQPEAVALHDVGHGWPPHHARTATTRTRRVRRASAKEL